MTIAPTRPGPPGPADMLTPTVATRIVDISPTLAQMFLAKNARNRPTQPARVAAIARDMLTGRWDFNGESIKVATDGTLLDGQHRLLACVQSGVTFRTVVVTGLPVDAQDTVDLGKARTASDQTAMAGYRHSSTVAAVARRGLMWDTGARDFSHSVVTVPEVMAYLRDHPGVIDSAAVGARMVGRSNGVHCQASTIGTAHWITSRIDPVTAEAFFDGLGTGANLPVGSPMLALRERFATIARTPGHVLTCNLGMALLLRAWNAYRDGRPLARLLVTGRAEGIPEPR